MTTLNELMDAIPESYRRRFRAIVELTDRFCDLRLNDEYKLICRRMASRVCAVRLSLHSGRAQGWASGVVHAVGYVNFLHDPERSPHLSPGQVAEGFGISVSTMSARSRQIRQDLELIPFHPDWCLPALVHENPLVWIVDVNGIAMDARRAPRELQEAAYDQGLIPYIPADRPPLDAGYEDEDGRVLGRISQASGY